MTEAMLAVCLRTALMVGIEGVGGYVNVKGGYVYLENNYVCEGVGYQGSMGMCYALPCYLTRLAPCPALWAGLMGYPYPLP
jgi:hypothetical protein